MKKALLILLSLVAALSLFACKGDTDSTDKPSAEGDWRNTVEYEGSFFVNEKLRLLYALDRGVITLWDNGGNGEVMQKISYDTSVADAIERIEKKDFSGDGNCDLRIIYAESDAGTRYNLFLWSEVTKGFVDCSPYREIINPVHDSETNNVTAVWDKGAFGTVTRVYSFNESSGMDTVSTTVSDPDGIAAMIAGSYSSAEPVACGWIPEIKGKECKYYYACIVDGKPVTYIGGTEDSEWFVDLGAIGFFRPVVQNEDGDLEIGEYIDKKAQTAAELAVTKTGSESAVVIAMDIGSIDGNEAYLYTVNTVDGVKVYIACDSLDFWYYSENGEKYIKVLTSTGEAIGEGEYEFAVAEEEQ
ncbi:MAG: hypothetical protein IJD22_05050 [Clostridia bacterium]|nr:hypothetical protein [Clostridia bacterium]